MRLLDLFCGAGGASMGYHRAGFEVEGVDIKPQKNYPFKFYQADAFEFLREHGHEYDVIHASPPCQCYTTLKGLVVKRYEANIDHIRLVLNYVKRPYIIENVEGAPLINPIKLCGSTFGLKVWRHRLFELSYNILFFIPVCRHDLNRTPIDVTGTGGLSKKSRISPGGGLSRKPKNIKEARESMGIDWMTRAELSQAIPPAYTQWIGERIMEYENETVR